MGFVNGILTILLFMVNFLLFLIALVLIYLGLFSTYPIAAADAPPGDTTYSVISNVILSISVFVAAIAFTGCYGVATDNKLCLLVYSTTLLVLIAIQIFLALTIHDKLESMEGSIGNMFTEVIRNETLKDDGSKDFMHQFQRKHHCCGFESYKDWFKVLPYIPGSCCKKANTQPCDKFEVAGKSGCAKIMREGSEELFEPIKKFLIVIFGMEVFLAASTICIVISSRD